MKNWLLLETRTIESSVTLTVIYNLGWELKMKQWYLKLYAASWKWNSASAETKYAANYQFWHTLFEGASDPMIAQSSQL